MKTLILCVFCLAASPTLIAQNLEAYQIFDSEGKHVDFGHLVKSAAGSEVVLFGELHNNPISHWLQLELAKELFELKGQNLVIGAEMFEADNQLILDEYFGGLISERNFESEARLWGNFETDIKPELEFARQNRLRFIATNIPRRYASLVNRHGFEGLQKLSADALNYIAPLPIEFDPELPGYKAMLRMTGMPGHNAGENLPKAQAIKDATMAHFIMINHNPGDLLLHLHGTYHSNNYEGIYWYIRQADKNLKIITIATAEQQSAEKLDDGNKGIADFIIVTPVTMTRTH